MLEPSFEPEGNAAQWKNQTNLRLGSSESEGSPGEGNGNPLQHSCLKNPMDRGAYHATPRACVLSHFSHVHLFVTLWTVVCQAPLTTGFSGKNTGVACYALLQGIFLTQGSDPHLFHLLHRPVGSLPLVAPRKPMLQSMVSQSQTRLSE